MHDTRSFYPMYLPSVGTTTGTNAASITVTASTSAAASAQFPGNLDQNNFQQIQIANKTSAWAHVNFGKSGAITAATVAAGYPVAPGAVVVVSVNYEVSGASVILDAAPSASASVVFTRGEGI